MDLPDGRTRVLMRYGDLSWMVRLVLSLGGDAVIEGPAGLAEAVRSRAYAALRRLDQFSAV